MGEVIFKITILNHVKNLYVLKRMGWNNKKRKDVMSVEKRSMNRRSFLASAALILLPRPDPIGRKSQPVLLPNDKEKLLDMLPQQFDVLTELARTPGREVVYRFPTEEGMKQITFMFVRDDDSRRMYQHPKQGFPHLRIRHEGKPDMNILLGQLGTWPALRFAGNDGRTLLTHEQSPHMFLRPHYLRGDRLIAIGVAIVAAALTAWLGVKVGVLVLAAIAFLAFYAVIMGLFVVIGGFLLQHLRELLGWNNLQQAQDALAYKGILLRELLRKVTEHVQRIQLKEQQ